MNPLNTQSFTSQQKYGRILNALDNVAKRQGLFNFNPSEKLVSIMLHSIQTNDSYDKNTKASLTELIQNINIKPEQIQEMINSSDSVNAFGIKNVSQATEFNKLFDNAVKRIALDVLKLEKQSSFLIKEKVEEIGVYNLSRDINAFKQFSDANFINMVADGLQKDMAGSVFTEEEVRGVIASYCNNLYEEYLNTETIQKEVHIEVEIGDIEEELEHDFENNEYRDDKDDFGQDYM
jgi:hypothetical protein